MVRGSQEDGQKQNHSVESGNQEDTSNRGAILTRRLVIGSVLGLGSAGAGIYLNRPRVIQGATEKKVQAFTLDRESYVVVGKPENVPPNFVVYSDQDPKTLHLMNRFREYYEPMYTGRGNTRKGDGTVLPPGKYYISSVHETPAVRASPVSFLREDTGPIMTLSEYLIAMRRELLLPVKELIAGDQVETVGVDKETLLPAPQGSVVQKEDLNTLFERTRAYEKRVKPPVDLAGGGVQDKYQSIVEQMIRARASIYIYHLLAKTFNLDDILGQLSSVLSALPNIPSEVSDNLDAVYVMFYCSSAVLDERYSGHVPVGISVTVRPEDVEWEDIKTRYDSQTVPIPVTRESKDPPRWKTPISDIKNELVQEFNKLV